jgi:hypothetical protein
MAIELIGSPSGVKVDVDAAPKAARLILYGPDGTPITPSDRTAIIPGSRGGALNMGADYKIARLIRCSSFGTLRTSDDTMFLQDSVEGAAVDTNKWIQTLTTMTVTQAVATGTLFNAGSSVATTVGAMHTSHRRFPFIVGAPLVFRCRARMTTHFANNVVEMGFGAPASATAAAVGDGAIWRKDATGQILPVIAIGGAEILGTPISDAAFRASVGVNDYAIFEVMLESTRARFNIYTQTGALVLSQDLDWTVASASLQVTHVQAMIRTYNSGGTGTAVQLFVHGTSIIGLDTLSQRGYDIGQSGMNLNSLTSPTAYTQLAQYANSADPTAAVLSNVAASYATLGGLFIGPTPTPAGAVTDFALFGWANPSPYSFIFQGIKITAMNRGTAVATTATVLEWALAFNSSGVSLATGAPYTPMRVPIGRQVFPIGATVESLPSPDAVVWSPQTPLVVQPGRFLHVILRIPVGTATAAGFLRGGVVIDGYFE